MPLLDLLPLGFRADGRPFWAFSGGEGEGEGGDGGDDSGAGGDGGNEPEMVPKSDLDGALATTKKVRNELRGWKAPLAALGIRTPEELVARLSGGGQQNSGSGGGENGSTGQQQNGGQQFDADAERRRIEAEVRAAASRDVTLAKIEAMAAKTFADPTDAALYLGRQVDDLMDDDGKPDPDAITRALNDLLTKKPHLKAAEERPTDFEGGARGTASAPQSMDAFLRDVSARKRGR